MSWCDKLASTPGAGFQLDFHAAPSDEILRALSPVLDELVDDDRAQFNIQNQGPFNVEFATDGGLNYAADSSRISVTFKHRMKAKAVSGGAPTMEMLSVPLPYTELLPTVTRALADAALLLANTKPRRVRRVGIISYTAIAEDELPPGLARFIDYLGRPWNESLSYYNVAIAGDLKKTSKWRDRCVHTLRKDEGADQLVNVQLDWQRIFLSARAANRNGIVEMLREAERDALSYFEEVAEGSLFDEKIISSVGV